MSYTNTFGATSIAPSQPSYLSLTISASTALVWPLEGGAESSPAVAAKIDVQASAANLSVAMPPGNTGSPGATSIFTNTGTNSVTVTDTSGNQIAVLAATQSWVVTLTSNATLDGTWEATQLGATTSQSNAGALAGGGLQAAPSPSTALQVYWPTNYLTVDSTLTAADRHSLIVWIGPAGTIQLDAWANLTVGWCCAITNAGTGPITLTAVGGAPINGLASAVLQPGNSGLIVCTVGQFYTVGTLFGAVSLLNGGTGATSAPQALTNLGGSAIGQAIFTAPTAAAVISALGLRVSGFYEATTATDQTLNSTSTGTAYVCSAVVTLTLPLSTGLSNSFYVAVGAGGGNVTLTPQASDKINGGAAGASYVIPAGAWLLLVTDANGNFWPLIAAPLNGSATENFAMNSGTAAGSLTVGGTLSAAGEIIGTAAGTGLSITNNGTIGGALNVGGTLGVTGAVSFAGELSLTAAGTALAVTNNGTVGGAINVGGTLGVTGALVGSTGDFSGQLTVPAATASGSAVNLSQSLAGATLQNVTASRAFATTYTNSTQRPIILMVAGSGANVVFSLLVNGATVLASEAVTGASDLMSLTGVVPPGATYEVTGPTGTFSSWTEFR